VPGFKSCLPTASRALLLPTSPFRFLYLKQRALPERTFVVILAARKHGKNAITGVAVSASPVRGIALSISALSITPER